MKHQQMTVKNGKFFKGDIPVITEHGNKEQIDLLKRVQEMQDGFDPKISIKKIIHLEFTCVCGAHNDFNSFTEIDENDPDSLIEGETDSCHCCGLKFKVHIEKTYCSEAITLKLIP